MISVADHRLPQARQRKTDPEAIGLRGVSGVFANPRLKIVRQERYQN
jgi:hypothetical protein